jgi:collagenase-like PrtC family protease
VQQLQALTAKVKAIEEEEAKLKRARQYLQEVREAIADALELMPVHLAQKIAARFELLKRHASSPASTAEVKGPEMAEQRAAMPPQKRAPRPG